MVAALRLHSSAGDGGDGFELEGLGGFGAVPEFEEGAIGLEGVGGIFGSGVGAGALDLGHGVDVAAGEEREAAVAEDDLEVGDGGLGLMGGEMGEAAEVGGERDGV